MPGLRYPSAGLQLILCLDWAMARAHPRSWSSGQTGQGTGLGAFADGPGPDPTRLTKHSVGAWRPVHLPSRL